MERSPIRCAIVGYGPVFDWGRMRAVPGLHLVAICDRDPACAAKARDDFPAVDTCTDLRQLLDREEIDLVSAVTQHRTHTPIAVA